MQGKLHISETTGLWGDLRGGCVSAKLSGEAIPKGRLQGYAMAKTPRDGGGGEA
jgi:hypothetical protein